MDFWLGESSTVENILKKTTRALTRWFSSHGRKITQKKSQRCHLKHIYLTEVGDDAPTMEIGHPKDHWTLKPGYFEDPTPAIQVQTLW